MQRIKIGSTATLSLQQAIAEAARLKHQIMVLPCEKQGDAVRSAEQVSALGIAADRFGQITADRTVQPARAA
jgi:hypothetical protein